MLNINNSLWAGNDTACVCIFQNRELIFFLMINLAWVNCIFYFLASHVKSNKMNKFMIPLILMQKNYSIFFNIVINISKCWASSNVNAKIAKKILDAFRIQVYGIHIIELSGESSRSFHVITDTLHGYCYYCFFVEVVKAYKIPLRLFWHLNDNVESAAITSCHESKISWEMLTARRFFLGTARSSFDRLEGDDRPSFSSSDKNARHLTALKIESKDWFRATSLKILLDIGHRK